jgi:hypothetical protein
MVNLAFFRAGYLGKAAYAIAVLLTVQTNLRDQIE